jgi:nucleoside-diphosphate-sugar epimerase
VGSDAPVTIAGLADAIAGCFDPRPTVEILGKPSPVDYYVPDITRARTELSLDICTNPEEAVRRTIAFNTKRL